MIDLEDLNKTWSIITKNKRMKTDAQVINIFRAVQQGKDIVKDMTPEMLGTLSEEDSDKVKRINLLFDLISEAQEKSFGHIGDKAFYLN